MKPPSILGLEGSATTFCGPFFVLPCIFPSLIPLFWPSETSFARLHPPPSSPTQPRIPGPTLNSPFLSVFSPASFRSFGLRWRLRSLRAILASRLCIQQFRSPRQGFQRPDPVACREFGGWEPQATFRTPSVSNYWGFNPSASHCRLH